MNTLKHNFADVPRTDSPHVDRFLRDLRDAWGVWQGERDPLDRRVSIRDVVTALRAAGIADDQLTRAQAAMVAAR